MSAKYTLRYSGLTRLYQHKFDAGVSFPVIAELIKEQGVSQ